MATYDCPFLKSVLTAQFNFIKFKQVFFSISNSKGHGFHGNKAIILHFTSKCYSNSLSVPSEKLEIGQVHQKL